MDRLEAFLRTELGGHPQDLAEHVAGKLSLPLAEVEAGIARLIGAGVIVERRVGDRRELLWKPIFQAAVTPDLSEDVVWRSHVAPQLKDVSDGVRGLLQFSFTEMLDNVVDHSGGKRVAVVLRRLPEEVELYVEDDGVGIFNKLQRLHGLEDPRHVALELSKGTLTTAPERHTGFFTSRMCDKFMIWSGTVACGHVDSRHWQVIAKENRPGTTVRMVVRLDTERTPKKVFDELAPPDPDRDLAFAKTSFQAELARHPGEELVSRSQAKRLMWRCERFREVTIDFSGIDSIGPAFADEIFRVFASQHPELAIRAVNTSAAVDRMIQRARGNGGSPSSGRQGS